MPTGAKIPKKGVADFTIYSCVDHVISFTGNYTTRGINYVHIVFTRAIRLLQFHSLETGYEPFLSAFPCGRERHPIDHECF